MTEREIRRLIDNCSAPNKHLRCSFIETHISWVILTREHAYKIKKPVRLSFLDFTSPDRRRHFCRREVELNNRLSTGVYIGVVPITVEPDGFALETGTGPIVDYAVKMKKLQGAKLMSARLERNNVAGDEITAIADTLSEFHRTATIVDPHDICAQYAQKFDGIAHIRNFLAAELGVSAGDAIDNALKASDHFLTHGRALFGRRVEQGFIRDCHGDVHSNNIFLYKAPIIFDCIEFRDDYRHIDVLDEVAFLTMDLEARGHPDLSAIFLQRYLECIPCMRNRGEERLYAYYLAYRANVRAKVLGIRAQAALTGADKAVALTAAHTYLKLMQRYVARFWSE